MNQGNVSIQTRGRQQGVMTLLVTSSLLASALMMSLGSYKGLFYQIKRAQNEVKARQQHWLVEGGLECAYAKAVEKGSPKFYDQNYVTPNPDYEADFWSAECGNTTAGLAIVSTKTSNNLYQLTSSFGSADVTKHIDYRRSRTAGALQSTSDLIVYGSTVFSPPDPGASSASGWKCQAVVFNRYFYSSGVSNKGLANTPSPYTGFAGGECATHTDPAQSYKTENSIYSGIVPQSFDSDGKPVGTTKLNVGMDFSQNTDLSPFEDFFGKPREEWNEVLTSSRYDFGDVVTPSNIKGCGNSILADLKLKKTMGKSYHTWVQGSCEIDAVALKAINSMTETKPALIMVQNGILSLNNNGSQGVIKPINGLLYHLNESYTHNTNTWNNTLGKTVLDGTPTVFDSALDVVYGPGRTITARSATFLQSGAVTFTGGVVFDTGNELALSNISMNFQYNEDSINGALGPMAPKWLKGSWNDQ